MIAPKTSPSVDDRAADGQRELRVFVFALFFMFGGITSLDDILIPKLKQLFTLSYGEVMLIQSAFFAAYLLFSLPAAAITQRLGYMRTAVVGLLLMMSGCLLFVPAADAAAFPWFLLALFVLAAGVTVVQVVSNPLISLLGAPSTAHSRLTFAQAFNSLGTTVFPYFGSLLILSAFNASGGATLPGATATAQRTHETGVIAHTYLGLAVTLVVLAGLVWLHRDRLVERPTPKADRGTWRLLRLPRFAFGTLCIFLYVGAEVAIGSLIVNYLMQSSVLALPAQAAGKHVPLYWGGAMIGRFIGSHLLRVFSPGLVLASAGVGVLGLLLISGNTVGQLSGYSLLAIGLFNSVMFPTIFTLACEGLGVRAAAGSGIICMAIVGGAVVPLLTGHAADLIGLKRALFIPAVCYAGIVSFGVYARHPVSRGAERAS
jgi:FHS family L-fucose permease-like MFS transporter